MKRKLKKKLIRGVIDLTAIAFVISSYAYLFCYTLEKYFM